MNSVGFTEIRIVQSKLKMVGGCEFAEMLLRRGALVIMLLQAKMGRNWRSLGVSEWKPNNSLG